MGSRNLRAFDVLGDTVDTAKRVRDQERGDDILCTFAFHESAPERLVVGDTHQARAKGKSCPVIPARLLGVKDAVIPPPSRPAQTPPAPGSIPG